MEYLSDKPLKQYKDLIIAIDDACKKSNTQICSLNAIIGNLKYQKSENQNNNMLIESRIHMAEKCVDELNNQIEQLAAQKVEADLSIAPVKESLERLKTLYSATESIQEIQKSLNLKEFNEVLIEENRQIIASFSESCMTVTERLNSLSTDIKCY